MRALRVAGVVTHALALLLAFVVSVVAHLPSASGRRALGSIANAVLAGMFRGRLRVGSVDTLALVRGGGRLIAHGVTIDDPEGVRIVSGGTLDAVPLHALVGALLGKPGSQMPTIRLSADSMILRPASRPAVPGQPRNAWLPSIAETFSSPVVRTAQQTREAEKSNNLHFPRIELAIRRLTSELGDIPATAFDARAVAVLDTDPLHLEVRPASMGLRIQERPEVRLDASFFVRQERAAWNAAQAPGEPVVANARPRRGWAQHLGVDGTLHSVGAECTIRVRRDDTGPTTADLSISTGRCYAPSSALARLAPEAGVLPDVDVAEMQARVAGNGPLEINANGRVGSAPFRVDGRSEPGATPHQRVSLYVDHLGLGTLRPGLPTGTLDGTVSVVRHDGEITLDARRFYAVIAGVPVPPLLAVAHLEGTHLTLDSLTAEQLHLEASGRVDLADVMHSDAALQVHTSALDLAALPFVGNRAAGSFSVDVDARRVHGVTEATVRGRAFALRTGAVRVGHARIDASGHWDGEDAVGLDASVEADGVVVPGAGPLTVRVRAAGDPRTALAGTLDVRGVVAALSSNPSPRTRPGSGPAQHAPAVSGTVAINTRFRVGLGADAIRAELTGARFTAQGATGTLTATAVVPRGPNAHGPEVRARIQTQGAGNAEIALRDDALSARFQRFDADWLGRVVGRPDWLSGHLEGDISLLTSAVNRASGTVAWRGGRLPGVGGFDFSVRVVPQHGHTEIGIDAAFGDDRDRVAPDARQTINGVVHAAPPRSLANVTGWLQGMRDAQISLRNVNLGQFAEFLPPGTRVDGAVGAEITVRRAGPGQPIDARVAVDARDVVPALDAAGALPDSLRNLVRRTVAPRPLTVPLRARVAVCARLLDDRLERVEMREAFALGRDTSNARPEPPADCTEGSVNVAGRLLHSVGAVRGPWRLALARASAELARSPDAARAMRISALTPQTRDLLADSPVQVSVTVGPIDNERWPFAAAISLVTAALRRSPIPGTAQVTVGLSGTLASPRVRTDAVLDMDDLSALVSRDALHVEAHAEVTPDAGSTLFGPVQMQASATAGLIAHTMRGDAAAGSVQAAFRAHGELRRLADPAGEGTPLSLQQIELRTDNFDLGRLAWARAHSVEGTLSLNLHGTGDPVTPVTAAATLANVRVRQQHRAAGVLGAFLRKNGDVWEVQACSVLHPGEAAPPACDPDQEDGEAPQGGLRLSATLPLRGPIWRLDPDTDGVHAVVAAQAFRLETISPFVETAPILRVGGSLTMPRMAWSAASPRNFSGNIQIREGLLEIDRIGQPARNLELDAEARARQVQVRRLAFSLGSLTSLGLTGPRSTLGTLEAHGNIDLREVERGPNNAAPPDIPRRCRVAQRSAGGAAGRAGRDRLARVSLDAHVSRLPAMLEGRTYAVITSDMALNMDLMSSSMRGELSLSNMSVNVPDEPSRDLQDVSPHGAVFVMGTTRAALSAPSRPFPIDLAFCTQQPFWARRSDFDISVTTGGNIHYDRAGMALEGAVELRSQQSYFELFSKRFFFDRVVINFDGGTTFDPSLDVQARYDSTGTGRIRVIVSGRLSAPEINFVSERFPEASQSDVIALLVLGRRDSRGQGEQTQVDNATQQAATQLIGGVLLGLASDYVRNATREGQIGFVARPIVEPGTGGQVGRYGAGVTIDAVSRLYVEGTYGTPQSTGSSSSGTNVGQEGRLFVEYAATDHVSIGATFGVNNTTGVTGFRTALDVFLTP